MSATQAESRPLLSDQREKLLSISAWLAPRLVVWVALSTSAGLWIGSIGEVDIRQITDIGLISEAPIAMFASIGIMALGFAMALRLEPFSVPAALAATLLLIGTIHGLPGLVEDAPRFAVAYLHAGFTDVIARDGALLTGLDARFSWPIFFSLGALVTQVAGIGNAIELQPWAAVAVNLLTLIPLLVIYESLSGDRRHVWTGVFVFYAANWIGQDYYAPQAFNFFLYLSILAILLRWFRIETIPRWIEVLIGWLDRRLPALRRPMRDAGVSPVSPPVASAAPRQRAMLVAVIGVLLAVSVSSHQLTPFALFATITALTVLRRIELRGLPVLIAVLIGLWISYMTVAYLAGHLVALLSDIGAAGETATANVGRRLAGSPGHVFVVQFRLAATLLFWLAAFLGALRRFRHGNVDVDAIVLGAVPFGLLLLQAYGGEMLLRVYLFSSPFLAFLVAGLIFPSPTHKLGRPGTVFATVGIAAMLVSLMVTKHGNERGDAISAEEIAVVDELFALAPPDSNIGYVTSGGPLRYRHVGVYRVRQVAEEFLTEDTEALIGELERGEGCNYLFLSRSQEASLAIYNSITPAEWDHALQVAMDSGRFEIVLGNRDAAVLLVTPAPAVCRGA